MKAFSFARMPEIVFGAGSFEKLPGIMVGFGKRALVITGGASHREPHRWEKLVKAYEGLGGRIYHAMVRSEPSPKIVDECAKEFRDKDIEVVAAWGGGSVVDAGKAVSAMLREKHSVENFLEGVGVMAPGGDKAPFIAVPTTAGTGSEATNNAVISSVGERGYKKSLRHENYCPNVALIDPKLHAGCPPDVSAASGMDAFSQLLEAWVSTEASPMTDALALSGLKRVEKSLVAVCTDSANDPDARGDMAYAALMSGIVLSRAGLGTVHGLAGPIGGFFDIPHGVACGALVGAVASATVGKLMSEYGPGHPALAKFAKAGAVLAGVATQDVDEGCALLEKVIREWNRTLKIPMLGAYGITENDFSKITDAASNKNNPYPFKKEEMAEILRSRL